MSLGFDVNAITALLLAEDGWTEIEPGSFRFEEVLFAQDGKFIGQSTQQALCRVPGGHTLVLSGSAIRGYRVNVPKA